MNTIKDRGGIYYYLPGDSGCAAWGKQTSEKLSEAMKLHKQRMKDKHREKLKHRIARIIARDRGIPALELQDSFIPSEEIAEKILQELGL